MRAFYFSKNFTRAFLAFLLVFASFTSYSRVYYYWCLRYSDNGAIYAVRATDGQVSHGYLWVHQNFPNLDGHDPFYIIGSDPRVWLYSSRVGQEFESDDVTNMNNFFEALENPEDFQLLDYNVDPSSGLPPYKPTGSILKDNNGVPYGVVGYDENGDRSVVSVTANPDGSYSGVGYDSNGNRGVYTTQEGPDGIWFNATFKADTVVDTSTPESVQDNITPPALDSNGNVSTPSTTVTIPDGNGGSSSFQLPDYTPLLSQIAANQIEGINRRDSSFQQLNENLKNLFTADAPPVSDINPFGEVDFSSVQSEADSILSETSGWDFSFGMGANPVGNIITSLFGNPPTSFGSVDQVWDIEIPIFNDVTVRSSFRLSDYFVPAFRSALLMILTIVFAIAVARQISGAFS